MPIAPGVLNTLVRLIDLMENYGLSRDTKNLDTLVFDEADQLLEMGFRPAIESILRNLPSKVRESKHSLDVLAWVNFCLNKVEEGRSKAC